MRVLGVKLTQFVFVSKLSKNKISFHIQIELIHFVGKGKAKAGTTQWLLPLITQAQRFTSILFYQMIHRVRTTIFYEHDKKCKMHADATVKKIL